MIHLPIDLETACACAREGAEVRAGGTDYMERLELGLAGETIVDLRDVPGLDRIDVAPGRPGTIGAKVTIAAIAKHPGIRELYPALAMAAGALATPEIRSAATVGGGLLQRSRCWYYRNPVSRCLKSGGDRCLAREGDHLLHVCFDLGPCVAPHPSTLGMALLLYDAQIGVAGGPERSVAALYGDGSSVRDHQLAAGEILTEVRLPAPLDGERGGYHRAIARARAEWPLVEVSARLAVDGGRISHARVAIGGVAPVPLRLLDVERALEGGDTSEAALESAAALAQARANPLPMTRYKVAMLAPTVFDALHRAVEG